MSNRSSISTEASALITAAEDKAGMDDIDRSKIDSIILRESGDSAFMKQQRKRDKLVNEKITQMKRQLEEKDRSSQNWKRSMELQIEPELQKLVDSRNRRSMCVVVDMDMFYFACEALSRPELKDKPACVGEGMILTSNYCARKYGVRSAMAGWIGDTLVSELSGGKERLIHVPSHFQLYTEKSLQVRQVLAQYDPGLKAYSVDEAYLDIGPYVALSIQGFSHEQIQMELKKEDGVSSDKSKAQAEVVDQCVRYSLDVFPEVIAIQAAETILHHMRAKVCEITGGLTCSAGLASNFMLAKIASQQNKPNGQCIVGSLQEDVLNFLHPMPPRKVPGIGRVNDKILHAFGINTVADLYTHRAMVNYLFKPATASFLIRVSVGNSNDHEPNNDESSSQRKGISHERTFQSGRPWNEVKIRLEEITQKLSEDMRAKCLWAQTVTVKVKLNTFDVICRSKTLKVVYIQESDDLLKVAIEMLHDVRTKHKGTNFSVRLIGLRCSNFQGKKRKQDYTQATLHTFLTSSVVSKSVATFSGKAKTSPHPVSERSRVNWTIKTGTVPTTKICCPMCQQLIDGGSDNVVLNNHIDSCLNSSTIRAAVQEESLAAQRNKKPRLTHFTCQKMIQSSSSFLK